MLRRDFKEMLGSEILSNTGGIIAGTLLALFSNKIELIPGLLILIPGFLEMKGSISGSLAARLSSGLVIGAVKPEIKWSHLIKGNVIAAVFLALCVSAILGLNVYGALLLIGINNFSIVLISITAGVFVNLIGIPLIIYHTFRIFKEGHDPNNIMGPFVTAEGDMISIVALLIAITVIV